MWESVILVLAALTALWQNAQPQVPNPVPPPSLTTALSDLLRASIKPGYPLEATPLEFDHLDPSLDSPANAWDEAHILLAEAQ